MREILFRGKRTDNGEWVEGSLIQRDLGCFIVDKNNRQSLRYCSEFVFAFDCVLVKSETVGQCGLIDKNGTKIFEGDILKSVMWWLDNAKNGVVTFRDGAFGFIWYRGKVEMFHPFTSVCNIEYEVIGNIYDNPDLLKTSLKPEYLDGDPDRPICPRCRMMLREMEDCDCGQKIDWSEE